MQSRYALATVMPPSADARLELADTTLQSNNVCIPDRRRMCKIERLRPCRQFCCLANALSYNDRWRTSNADIRPACPACMAWHSRTTSCLIETVTICTEAPCKYLSCRKRQALQLWRLLGEYLEKTRRGDSAELADVHDPGGLSISILAGATHGGHSRAVGQLTRRLSYLDSHRLCNLVAMAQVDEVW